MTIAQLNALDAGPFVEAVGFAFEDSPWIAREAWNGRPFRSVADLHAAMTQTVERAPQERRIALISAHPDLAGRVAREGRLTAASADEQRGAGLDRLTPAEIERFETLNGRYRERFGFPFVICARKNSKATIFAALEMRLKNERTTEIATALAEIGKIARLRLAAAVRDS